MDILKSVFRGICEVLQFISLLVLSGITIYFGTELVCWCLHACGLPFVHLSEKAFFVLLCYTVPVMAGILYWRSRKEYWEMCKSLADQNKNTNQ